MAEASPFMQRALAAARGVRGHTSPNPWVGAALVRGDRVVAEGATSPDGGPHAEAG
ncbi:MAG: riboflavin biosynthesis protein RibD, partial [Dehalococcoidia bacterium]|nr:riboflavin biosynthesis protein RibD [Dehalococcoidia bacterium]